MSLSPSPEERIARARADLRMGVPIALRVPGGHVLVAAAETLTADRLSDMRSLGPLTLAITARRAETLLVRVYDGDLARISVPDDVSKDWIASVANPAIDMGTPLKGPFNALRDGEADSARSGIALARRALLLPSVVTVPVQDSPEGITKITAEEIVLPDESWSTFSEVSAAGLPMAASKAGRVHVFRSADGAEEHYAVEIGVIDRASPVLARLHSACFTGDVLGSLKCDCGPQLRGALGLIGQSNAGILLYLNQEGRGIGLANKMRAYALQDQGFDTVEANHRLGFEDDERNFRIGADILRRLGIYNVRLMTNNPRKVEMMQAAGVTVTERVPLVLGQTIENSAYLATKRDKSGHFL